MLLQGTSLSVHPKSAPVLTEAEQRLRAIIAKAPVVFFALDRNGVFTLSEGRALEKLGLQPGQVVGQSVFQLYRQYPQILESARRALAGEEFTSTGRLPDVDLYFETHWAPVRGPEGKLAGTIEFRWTSASACETNAHARKRRSSIATW